MWLRHVVWIEFACILLYVTGLVYDVNIDIGYGLYTMWWVLFTMSTLTSAMLIVFHIDLIYRSLVKVHFVFMLKMGSEAV